MLIFYCMSSLIDGQRLFFFLQPALSFWAFSSVWHDSLIAAGLVQQAGLNGHCVRGLCLLILAKGDGQNKCVQVLCRCYPCTSFPVTIWVLLCSCNRGCAHALPNTSVFLLCWWNIKWLPEDNKIIIISLPFIWCNFGVVAYCHWSVCMAKMFRRKWDC